jgi:hypothetical protein
MTSTKKYPSAKATEQTLGERFKNAIENEPPAGEQEREAYWNETLFLAMAELRAELKSENERVRSKAAHKIIDLERTKMRHGKRLGGTGEKKSDAADFVGVPPSGGLAGPTENEDRLKAERSSNESKTFC